jgi:hypothetical protein
MEAEPMDHLEVIADAIMHHEGWTPGSRSNRNRNPGNLRAGDFQVGEDAGGYAIFVDLTHGYAALVRDLEDKFVGHTRTGLTPASTFLQLIAVYAPTEDHNDPASYFQAVKDWFGKATGKTINEFTTLQRIWTVDDPQGSI